MVTVTPSRHADRFALAGVESIEESGRTGDGMGIYRRAGRYLAGVSAALVVSLGLYSVRTLLPADRDPLAEMVAASDLVVLAEVLEVRRFDTPASSLHRLARLRVRETWKGGRACILDVPFDASLLWPPPPRDLEGRLVVAFLKKGTDGWVTVTGTADAILRATAGEIDQVRRRVRRST